MKEKLSVRLDKDDEENLLFLYKHFQVPNQTDSKRFRKLLACVVEGIRHGSQDEKHLGHEEEVRLLEGWDCTYRNLIWPHNKYTKKKEPKIFCTHPTTRETLKTNELYITICKKCYDTGGSSRPLSLPAPKQQVSKPTPKPKPTVTKQECITCGTPIPFNIDKPRCIGCYIKWIRGVRAPGDVGHGEGLSGSPMQIRKRAAEKLRKKQSVLLSPEAFGEQRWQRVQARISAAENQTKEEIMKSAIEHGAELDHYFAEYDHRMKQNLQPKEE